MVIGVQICIKKQIQLATQCSSQLAALGDDDIQPRLVVLTRRHILDLAHSKKR